MPAEPTRQTGSELPFEGLRCDVCGYDLRGLDVPRCPECGTAFDSVSAAARRSQDYDFHDKIVRYGKYLLAAGVVASYCKALLETGNPVTAALVAVLGPIGGLLMVMLSAPWLGVLWIAAIAMAIRGGLRKRKYWPLALLGYFAAAATWVFLTFMALAMASSH